MVVTNLVNAGCHFLDQDGLLQAGAKNKQRTRLVGAL